MTAAASTEGLRRELAPWVFGAVARRHRDVAGAEDAVQEALPAATTTWPTLGEPDNPLRRRRGPFPAPRNLRGATTRWSSCSCAATRSLPPASAHPLTLAGARRAQHP